MTALDRRKLAIGVGAPLEKPMTDLPPPAPPPAPRRLLRTPDAALLLGLSARTLEKHRCYGTGPAYRKLGGRVVYAVEDLQAWAELGVRQSTSDPGHGIVHPAKRIDLSTLDRAGPVRR